MEIEEKLRFAIASLRPMAEATFPYLVRVAGLRAPSIAEPIGTGFLVRADQSRLLATASHVLEKGNDFDGIAISQGLGKLPFTIPNGSHPVIDVEADLAVLALPETYQPGPDRRFFDLGRADDDPGRRFRDYLFAHGFPGARARFVSFEGFGLVSNSLPVGAMQREPPPSALGRYRFAMHYEGTGGESSEAGVVLWVHPKGLSGSPVFRIGGIDGPIADWSPDRSRLIGVVTGWDQESQSIIVSEVSRLMPLVPLAIAAL